MVEPRTIKRVDKELKIKNAPKFPAEVLSIAAPKPTKKPETVIKTQKFDGVVKGPKTMPANKKTPVQTETVYESNDQEKETLLERAQDKQLEEVTEEEIKQETAFNIPMPAFDIQDDGSKKMVIFYVQGKSNLEPVQQNILDNAILPALNQDTSSRLLIEAYASPQEDKPSADRRVALSRALAIRKYLLEQKIPSNRIDVRSLGAQSNAQPLDRVELFLIPWLSPKILRILWITRMLNRTIIDINGRLTALCSGFPFGTGLSICVISISLWKNERQDYVR